MPRKSLRRVERQLGESCPPHQRSDHRAREHDISAPENESDAEEIDVERELAGELLSGRSYGVRRKERASVCSKGTASAIPRISSFFHIAISAGLPKPRSSAVQVFALCR